MDFTHNGNSKKKNPTGFIAVAVAHLVFGAVLVSAIDMIDVKVTPFVVNSPFTPPVPPTVAPPPPPTKFNLTSPQVVITPVDPTIVIETPREPPPTITGKKDDGKREPYVPTGGPIGDPVIGLPEKTAPVRVAAVVDANDCTKPAYPNSALRNGDTGVVTLSFLIGKGGNVIDSKVDRSSGHRELDRAAVRGLELCKFKPGTIDGVPQQSWTRMEYVWNLE